MAAAALLAATLFPAGCSHSPAARAPDEQAVAARRTIDAALAAPPAVPGGPVRATDIAQAAQVETRVAATFAALLAATESATRLTPIPTPTPDAAATRRAAGATATAGAVRMETAVAATFAARVTETAVATRLTPEPTPTPTMTPSRTPTNTPRPTATPTITPTASRMPTITPTPTRTPNQLATRLALTLTADASARAKGTATVSVRATATTEARILSRVEQIRATLPTLRDGFASDWGYWNLWSEDGVTISIGRSELTVRVDSTNLAAWTSANDIVASDLFLEADMVRRSGPTDSDFGLVFRKLSADSFYSFTIDGLGNYSLSASRDDGWETIVPWTHSTYIETESGATNRLGVLAESSTITLFVNQEVVARVEGIPIDAGEIALVVTNFSTGGTEVAFDNVSLWVLD